MSNIVENTKRLADVVEDAARYGITSPQILSVTTYAHPTLLVSTFAEVEEWADYLHTEAERRVILDGERESLTATADLSDVYGAGFTIQVTTNRTIGEVDAE